jgi:thiosulfate reductase cytochrome b subunit
MGGLGKLFIVFGLILVLVGLLISFGAKLPWIGRLPGDIYIKKEHFSFFFPITTSIIISIILTLVIYFFRK